MKVLQVVRQYHPSTGGMEEYVVNLCRQLRRRGHETDVATLDYLFKSDTSLPPYGRHEDIDIIRLPSWGNARYFFAPRLLELAPRYDLVHVHGVDFFIELMGVFRRLHGKPVVLSTHGGFFHTAWFPTFKQAYFHSLTRYALRGVDCIIASSPSDEQLFRRISKRVRLVANGIDYAAFAGIEKVVERGRLVFVGRMSRNKRVDRLLLVLAQLRKSQPQARLVVIGPDWEGLGSGLERLASELGLTEAIQFKGPLPREEMLAELGRAHLFVSASEYEAFGISTVEAMAGGTVVAVNHIPAFGDIIDDGRTGFLVDFEDESGAAAMLESIITMPLESISTIGAAAREAARRYDWQTVADEVIAIYKQVAAT